MKKGFLILGITGMVAMATQAQDTPAKPFEVTGKLTGVDQDVALVYLQYSSGSNRVMDSAVVSNGTYSFKGELPEAVIARLSVKYSPVNGEAVPIRYSRDAAMLFLEPGNIKVDNVDSFSNVKVTGSAANADYEILKDLMKPFDEQLQELNNQYPALAKAKDEEGIKKLTEEFEKIQGQKDEVYKLFIESHPSSPIAIYVLGQYAGYALDAAKVEPLYNKIAASQRALPSGKSLGERIDIAKKTNVGEYAMDFTQTTPDGKSVSLSSFKGKYVLVDFWASWCGPCRMENPNVVKAYNSYKEKGFEVLGVSLDKDGDKDKWMQAIEKDGLAWTQVSDLQGWNNAAAKQYGIRAIPQNLLLDPQGKIIAKNLRGEALNTKLGELFN